jgi:excisionase family DNA binding protein
MHARSGPQDGDPALGDGRHNGRSEPRLTERRLLSPEQAAAYLGLRSRFAVYRLVASGQIPALRLANKLRIDLQDLELLIEKAKTNDARGTARSAIGAAAARAVPFQLAPLARRRRAVTRRVTASRDGV